MDRGQQVQGLDLGRASSIACLPPLPSSRSRSTCPLDPQDIILSHFLLHRPSIQATLASWAAADPRLEAWTPALNATAGTHLLEPYRRPVYNPVGGVGAQEAAAPAGPAPRDLVREVDEALEALTEWKDDVVGWLEGLVA